MKVKQHRLEDFLLSESFMRYVLERSPEDIDIWESWINDNSDSYDAVLQAREIILFVSNRRTRPIHPDLSEKVFSKLQQQIEADQSRQPGRRTVGFSKYYWYAASLIFLFGLGLLFKVLFVPDSFFAGNNEFLEIIVPEGQRSQMILPDGSKVWLNSGSHLKYPVNFLEHSREVYLTGEAFFDVTHKKNNLPFVVHLKENLAVRVLGTEFNVKSYDSEKNIETTLVDGSIRLTKDDGKNHILKEYYLKPNEKAVYQKDNNSITISELITENQETKVTASNKIDDIEVVTAWKNEELIFNNETFEEIAIRMERWYGMKISVKDDLLKEERFTGKFVNNESIYQILDIFNRSESIQYTTKHKEIIITKRKTTP